MDQKMNKLPDINNDFALWYQEVIYQSELVDQCETKGCFVFRPYSYAIWEKIQSELDKKIKATGTQNAYFPLLIPESFIKREAKHVEGFSPELAVVTHAGGEKLEEPLVVRPTSETMIYSMFARWIKSWRDLPLQINQWANVVRWEMRTRPFIRSAEFLWQEGHTAHYSHEEAELMAKQALDAYQDIYENYLAIPVIRGVKSESEKFAGAEKTYTLEGMMQDGKALQLCTSHILDQSFPAAFGVKFQDKDGTIKTPYCTSWGFTTRSIGAMIMVHGDQNGLIIPPRIAPIQAVIIPIYKTDLEKTAVLEKAEQMKAEFVAQDFRVIIDRDEQKTPGSKFFEWELKGVPVRIEIGPKDLEKNHAVFVNRVEPDKTKKKEFVPLDAISVALTRLLDSIHQQMFDRAKKYRTEHFYEAEKIKDFGSDLDAKNGFYKVGWCGDSACEGELKQVKASIRCLLDEKEHDTCFNCQKSSKVEVVVAKAY
jgi:prolyl-tRNA synthetase